MKEKKMMIFVITLFLIVAFIVWLYQVDFGKGKTIEYGVTFSQKYAQKLNLDWQKMYLAILDDLKVRKLRLSAYWDLIEKEKDKYDFKDLDWQIDQAQKRQAKVILAIGHRLPRWPECHWPNWSYKLNKDKKQKQILKLLAIIVNRYKSNQTIIAWQVENEPYLRLLAVFYND